MSSLKDIMDDVDVEPLQSQAYRRSKEAAQEQEGSHASVTSTSRTPPPPSDTSSGKQPVKRRRSNRVSAITLPQDLVRDTSAEEGMDYSSSYQAGPSSQQSPYRSSNQYSEPAADVPVKYTPVTGRISRAKKGVPVHTCEVCRLVKTFTRAEHLRRHQLSHQKPAYPCTFEDCERAFHRPDLLARHVQRHETQGEKAYKAGDPRSRASSSASDSRTPSLHIEGSTPTGNYTTMRTEVSSAESMVPGTSDRRGTSLNPSAFGGGSMSSEYQHSTFSGPGNLSRRTASQAQFPDASTYVLPSGPSRTQNSYAGLKIQSQYTQAQSAFSGSYIQDTTPQYNVSATPQLPTLTIPEPDERWNPALLYNNSPWCSSASDTASDISRNGSQWTVRGRSTSIGDWSQPVWAPQGVNITSQVIHNPHFETMPERFSTPFGSPRMVRSPSRVRTVEQPSFGTYTTDVACPTPLSACFVRRKTSSIGLQPNDVAFDTTSAFRQPALPTNQELYFNYYWQNFHTLFPIIHKFTFDYTRSSLLSYAIGAIEMQYLDSPDARRKGPELNEHCRKDLELHLDFSNDISVMQSVFLTEIFTRFRGRTTKIRSARHFSTMYDILLAKYKRSAQQAESSFSPTAFIDADLEQINSVMTIQAPKHNDRKEWHRWIEEETERRLLAACFFFDTHQSIVFQRPALHAIEDVWWTLVYFPSSTSIWEASSALEWKIQHEKDPQPLSVVDHSLSHKSYGDGPFQRSLAMCWSAARLPARIDPSYPNIHDPSNLPPELETLRSFCTASSDAHTYLGLYHTPLRDLLAVAGDTWVFGERINPPSAFHTAQTRIQIWSEILAAAQATWHACHVLSNALHESSLSISKGSLSDYWSTYVAALIAWAFGHNYQAKSGSAPEGSFSSDEDQNTTASSPDAAGKALAYTDFMLSLEVSEFLTSKAIMRGDTASMIEVVRRLLVAESVGNECGLLDDAIAVLDKILKAGNVQWF